MPEINDNEMTPSKLCESYGSKLGEFPEGSMTVLIPPTETKPGKESVLAFGYGGKKYKVTFEVVDRVCLTRKSRKGEAAEVAVPKGE